MLMVLNAHHDLVEFTLPDCFGGRHWRLELDTQYSDGVHDYKGRPGDQYGVAGRSLNVFIASLAEP
jgi:glycogen operon protein